MAQAFDCVAQEFGVLKASVCATVDKATKPTMKIYLKLFEGSWHKR